MTPLLAFIVAVRALWVFTILIGTGYIVFVLGYSGWWWVLAIALIACASNGDVTTTTKTETKS